MRLKASRMNSGHRRIIRTKILEVGMVIVTMSENLSGVTFCVVDHGFFLPVARRLAESGARVLYHNPSWQKAFPIINEGIIGEGFKDIEWCPDLWPVKHEVDCFVFPDIYHQGLQTELRSQGFPVWGSGDGMQLETNRTFFLTKLKELGLDVPEYEIVTGITNLRLFLQDKKDIYIKVSRWRGSWETRHWRSFKEDGHKLDNWAFKFGGVREHIRFICFPKIDTKLEIGCDTFNIHGQWPDLMLHGIEKKDEAYFSAVTKKSDMPEELTHIMDAFSEYLQKVEYRGAWSMEVRVTESEAFFIDATTRGGLPSTGSQLMAMTNFAKVVLAGAQGVLEQPEYNCQFTAECMVKISGDAGAWETIVVPDALKQNLKLADCCEVDGQVWFPSDENPICEIGWLVATGGTPTETFEQMNELADELPDGADAAVESLADIVREIEEEEKQGIHFTEQPLPDPEVVLQP